MSSQANVIYGRSFGGSDTLILARIRNPLTGALVTIASISTITWTLRDLTAGTQAGSGSLTPSAVLFDSLQTGGAWYADSAASPGDDGSTGYNFSWTISGTYLQFTPAVDGQGNPLPHVFYATLTFTPTAGGGFKQVFSFPALAAY